MLQTFCKNKMCTKNDKMCKKVNKMYRKYDKKFEKVNKMCRKNDIMRYSQIILGHNFQKRAKQNGVNRQFSPFTSSLLHRSLSSSSSSSPPPPPPPQKRKTTSHYWRIILQAPFSPRNPQSLHLFLPARVSPLST